MEINLSGRVALVCGASQGIGAGIAKVLASCGATIILVARSQEKLDQLLVELDGDKHLAMAADLMNQEDIKTLCTQLVKRPIDIVINNTGGPAPGNLVDAEIEAFHSALQMHLFASHTLMQAVLPGMKERLFGRFLNVISTSVKIPIPGLGVSNTTRGAMASWSKTLANEVGAYGITVNNILPGLIETSRLDQLISNTSTQKQITKDEVANQLKSTIPAGRFGQPEELGRLAAFLCSEFGSYINGVSIAVDGGRTGAL